jgi:hypothetical protein
MAMFINHSCDANCETSEIGGRVWIKSIRAIAAGEEITYDYCLYDGGDDEAICNCGAKKCRGTMYSKEEIRRRKRAMGPMPTPRNSSAATTLSTCRTWTRRSSGLRAAPAPATAPLKCDRSGRWASNRARPETE